MALPTSGYCLELLENDVWHKGRYKSLREVFDFLKFIYDVRDEYSQERLEWVLHDYKNGFDAAEVRVARETMTAEQWGVYCENAEAFRMFLKCFSWSAI